jgi:hypothetical protein
MGKWVSRLQALGVSFCFRFPKSFKIKTPNGSTQTADRPKGKRIFEALSGGQYLLLMMGSFKPQKLEKIYQKRWSIEV